MNYLFQMPEKLLFSEAVGEKIFNVERLLLEYEDACERVELERKKDGEKLELSALVEKRQ